MACWDIRGTFEMLTVILECLSKVYGSYGFTIMYVQVDEAGLRSS